MAEFSQTPFEKGVVVAVYTGPDSWPEISSTIKLSGIQVQLERLPRNSVVVRRIDRGADLTNGGKGSYAVCYPFLSSHIQMPVKPAETVWVIFDRDNKNQGFWISRVTGDATAEDLNYSHFDRGFVGSVEKKSIANPPPPPPLDDFPNSSLANVSGSNPYDTVLSGAIDSYSSTTLQPVPRYTKFPGDLVLHGSNNSAVCLTVDRGWKESDNPTVSPSISSRRPRQFSGTVDIIAGRSRWLSRGETGRTVPPVRLNRRNFLEVSKRLEDFRSSKKAEGDPDFFDDAARVYVSESTDFVSNFDVSSVLPSQFGPAALPSPTSAVVAKADNVCLIARKDDTHSINGSVHIIKEGEKDSDLSAIMMTSEGNVRIAGNQIFLGRSTADGGEGSGPGPDGSQPYVKYQQLETLLVNVINDVRTFCDTLLTHTTPGYGAPSLQINNAATALRSAMDARESEIPTVKSTRIFGE
jgi:hypothetical protein